MIDFKRVFIEYMNIEVVNIDSAIVKECDMFFTNDKQLQQEKELPCLTMEDI